MGSRRIALALVSAFGLVVVLAAAAWACTSSAEISLNVTKGKPGSTVHVGGSGFPGNGKVDVYWAPNPGEPRLLFETDQSSFAQSVNIPEDATAGTHYIKAYGYGEDGELRGSATASFTVPHGTVAGQINDTDSGESVHGAEVSIADGGEVVGNARTEADGTYSIGDLEKGAYTVTAQRPGYEEASTQAEVRLGESSDVSFTLTRQPEDDASDSGSGDPQADGTQSGPESAQTSEPEGSQAPRGSQGVESDQSGDSPAQGSTLQGSASGGPTPQESTAPEAGEPQQAGQPEQPAEDDPARQAVEPEPERQSVGAEQPERQIVGGADGATDAREARQAGGDTAANQPQSVGEPEPTGGQAQAGEPAAAADTTSEPNLGEAPADQAVSEPEAAESEAENAGHPAVGPDADASTPAPSARSGAADLWSGLAADDVATLGSDRPATDQSGETSQALVLAVGLLAVGLLGAGLLTLASGGAVAARRHRAPAEATSSERSG